MIFSPSRTRLTAAGALLLVAALLAGWMAWQAVQGGGVAGCAEGSGCAQVLSSRWAYVFGVPVSLPGAVLYIAAAVLAFSRRWALGFPWLAVLILGGALYFVAVQAFVLRVFCPWCCSIHALASLGAILGLTALSARRKADFSKKGPARPVPAFAPALRMAVLATGGLATGALAIAQVYGPQHETSRTVFAAGSGAASGTVASAAAPLLSFTARGTLAAHGRFTFFPGQLPQIGTATGADFYNRTASPVLFLHDWTCQHCRELHQQLRAKADSAFAFCLLPASREPEAREVHRLLLTAWMQRAAVYDQITEEILSGALAPASAALRARIVTALPAFAEKEAGYATPVAYLLSLADSVLRENDARLDVSTFPQLASSTEILTGAPSEEALTQFLVRARAAVLPISVPEVAPASALAAGPSPGRAPPPPVAIIANRSRIEFEQTTLSFPPVAPGGQVEADFRFRNTGSEPLQIVSVQTTCGCTAVDGWKQTVAPGADSFFKVTLTAPAALGPLQKPLTIRTTAANAGPDHSTSLAIATTVTAAPAQGPVVTTH